VPASDYEKFDKLTDAPSSAVLAVGADAVVFADASSSALATTRLDLLVHTDLRPPTVLRIQIIREMT
jgi:hypothetical protein